MVDVPIDESTDLQTKQQLTERE